MKIGEKGAVPLSVALWVEVGKSWLLVFNHLKQREKYNFKKH